MSDYYTQRRTIGETVMIGEKAVTVKADWQRQDGDERIDVMIEVDGEEHVFPNVNGDALRVFAAPSLSERVFLDNARLILERDAARRERDEAVVARDRARVIACRLAEERWHLQDVGAYTPELT